MCSVTAQDIHQVNISVELHNQRLKNGRQKSLLLFLPASYPGVGCPENIQGRSQMLNEAEGVSTK